VIWDEERMSEDKGMAALFDDMSAVGEGGKAAPAPCAVPRLQYPVRDQVELRACDLASLLEPERRAR
jgi:hypothetical protein